MILEIQNVQKHYGKKIALKPFTYTFTNGIYGILGPNGAGKTTLMNLISENLLPDRNSGRIFWNGTEIIKLGAAYREQIGYMPQQQNTYPSMSAIRFMGYIASLKGISRKIALQEAEALLKKVELFDVSKQKIGTFSGGMKQRLLLAATMLGQPKLLLLDEPTAGLDPRQRVLIREQIRNYSESSIILVVTHITSDIETIADQILMMRNGGIIRQGKIQEITKDIDGSTISLEQLYMKYYGENGDGDHAL